MNEEFNVFDRAGNPVGKFIPEDGNFNPILLLIFVVIGMLLFAPIAVLIAIYFLLKKVIGNWLALILMIPISILFAITIVKVHEWDVARMAAESKGTTTSVTYSNSSSCNNTFSIGGAVMYSHVDGTKTRLRAGAGSGYDIVAMIPEGSVGKIVGGPVCDSSYTWWNIEVNGHTGWTTEYTTQTGRLLERK